MWPVRQTIAHTTLIYNAKLDQTRLAAVPVCRCRGVPHEAAPPRCT